MDIHEVTGKLPRPKKGFVLPGHKYTGPYNPLDRQLDENDFPIVGQQPFNAVDALSLQKDVWDRVLNGVTHLPTNCTNQSKENFKK